MSHTPGPWREGKWGGSVVTDTPPDRMGYVYEILWYGGYVICESASRTDISVISAAPDLLAACKAFVRKVDEGEARGLMAYNGRLIMESYNQMKAFVVYTSS
jgi:hypothetical protein